MDLLILGGGVFLGRACLAAAVQAGHRVTVFNRGKARADWPADVEAIVGDRKSELERLAGRRWDAVIDTCGYLPRDVRASARALREHCRHYLFVSSVSAYASFRAAPVRETDALAQLGELPQDAVTNENYGALKAACEAAVADVFGTDTTIVRPGLIVGEEDRTGRFSYWPWRLLDGGSVLAPGRAERPVQFIDAADLGQWMVQLTERREPGTFNATGPAGGSTWGELLDTCHAAARAQGAPPSTIEWVDEAWLVEQKVQPWSELPLWVPSTDPEMAAFDAVDVDSALRAGLRTRPVRETVDRIIAGGVPAADDPRRSGKLSRERETALISSWRNRQRPAV